MEATSGTRFQVSYNGKIIDVNRDTDQLPNGANHLHVLETPFDLILMLAFYELVKQEGRYSDFAIMKLDACRWAELMKHMGEAIKEAQCKGSFIGKCLLDQIETLYRW